MMLEVSQEFYFEAAHTLVRDHETDSSRRLHGHTYHAEVTVRGEQDPRTGMVIDLAVLRQHIDLIRQMLDHRHLNEIDGLATPTLENLAVFIARHAQKMEPRVAAVRVWRSASGDSCFLELPPGRP
ncbi:MAG TPA: 6-carboxytetrahydropterin synthase [Steroidobacteraceae bacterium]|jgi:6-pyruvoyltetrahydropterin/6-carboxytetrahydropterin synthase